MTWESYCATVTYCDGAGEDDPFTPDKNELKDEEDAVSANSVIDEDYENTDPVFPDQNPDQDGAQTAQTREISEDASVGDAVGDEVVAEDEGSDGEQEPLTYTLVDPNPSVDTDDEDAFTIDASTGQIRVGANAKLNFEADSSAVTDDADEYTVTVRAADPSDTQADQSRADVEVTITVTDVNDDPVITRDPTDRVEFEFTENQPFATTILRTFAATDEDTGDNLTDGTLKWSVERSALTNQNDSARLTINEAGELTFAAQPDFDSAWNSNNTYKVKVVITDEAGRTDSEEVQVVVRNFDEPGTVTMSNRQAEVGTQITATLADEDGRTGTVTWEWTFTGTTTVTQANEDHVARYTPVDDHANRPINVTATYKNADGTEAIARASDDPEFVTTVDGRPSTRRMPTSNATNTAPKFIDSASCGNVADTAAVSSDTRDVDENTAAGVSIGAAITFCDAEDDNLTYSLSSGDTSSFDINRATGQLLTKASLNYETKTRYSVSVRAHDPTNANSTVSVTIDIGQVNEPPTFTEGDTAILYAEGSRGTHLVDTYKATDPEGVTVALTLSGDDADDFTFSNGILSFKQAPDYEDPQDTQGSNDPANEYNVTITASDGNTESDDVPRTVTIEVTNVDEDGGVTLSSQNPKEGIAITATLMDPDGSATDAAATDLSTLESTKWQWYRSSSKGGPWTEIKAADAAGGRAAITSDMRTYTPSSADLPNFYLRAGATYIDGHTPNGTDANTNPDKTTDEDTGVSANLVRMKDYVNTPPMFVDSDGRATTTATVTRRVLENTKAGTEITPAVKATDYDEFGNMEPFTYSVGENDGMFVVEMATGTIRIGADTVLNYESTDNPDHQYTLEVVATDPSGKSGTSTVTIMVINANEVPELVDTETAENLAATSTPEVDDDVDLAQTPYVRTISQYNARDDEDAAASPARELKWSLSGDDNGKFGFSTTLASCGDEAEVEGSTVLLCFKSDFLPDFEAPEDTNGDNVYNVTVKVTDFHENTTEHAVAVTVTNEEEDGEVELTNLVPEVGTSITAELADPDGGERDITWKWWAIELANAPVALPEIQCPPGVAGAWAQISGATARSYTPVSGDEGKCLAATARYRNAATQNDPFTPEDDSLVMATGTSKYVVKEEDTNNKAPVFPDQDEDTPGDQSDRATRHVHETTERDSEMNPDGNRFGEVGEPVTASLDQDGDTSRMGDILTYSLGGSDAALFTIDTLTDLDDTQPGTYEREIGQIRVGEGTVLDFETKNTYTVNVIATDPSGASDTIIVTINIVNVDEEPKFTKRGLAVSSGARNVNYPENGTADVSTYEASGADSAGASWSLEGEDADDFNISSGGVLTFRSSPNFESPTDANTDNAYNVTVKASNGSLSDTRSVTVTVTDVDEPGSVSISSAGNEVKVGVQLTAELDEGDEEVVTGWQWASGASASGNFTNISGATNNTYTPVDGDVGNFLRITVNYTDATHGLDSLSAVTATAVEAADVTVPGTPGTVSLAPSSGLVSGNSVTATLTDPDTPTNQVWQWDRSVDGSTNWTTISGATSATYTTTDDDGGNYLRASVTYDDDSGTGLTAGPVATTDPVAVDTYDTNRDGTIDSGEVITAVADYFDREITVARVLDVVALYFTGLNK